MDFWDCWRVLYDYIKHKRGSLLLTKIRTKFDDNLEIYDKKKKKKQSLIERMKKFALLKFYRLK